MSTDDRLDRLEQRMAVLEGLVRQLAAGGLRQAAAAPPPVTGAAAMKEPPPVLTPVPPPPAPTHVGPLEQASSVPPSSPSAPSPPPPPPRRPGITDATPALDGERWIGQRVFLGIGVVALLLAAGYLLKLSFERGWISPVMRCLGGVVAGLGVGALGWRLEPRYRTYGAALVGAGAGIIYLSIWAASKLYGVLPPTSGIVGLALVSISLAMIAYAIDVEALGITAALGAFLAPILLGQEHSNANTLLLYLASMAFGLGLVAARRRWRIAMFVIAASYFGVGAVGAAAHAHPWGLLVYGLAGGTAGLYLGLKERWWETRLLTFSGGWTLLFAAGERIPEHWAVLAAGLILSAPVWWHGLRHPRLFPLHARPQGAGEGWSVGEALYFFVTPVLIGYAVHNLDSAWFDAHPWVAPLIVGVPYVLAGYVRPRPAFAVVGAVALAVAAVQRWEAVPQVWALLALAVLWAALDRALDRTDGRWYGLVTLFAALQELFDGATGTRTVSDAAFVGPWALTLWGATGVTAAYAARLWRVEAGREDTRLIRSSLWTIAGALTLFGVTGELRRYFALHSLSADTAALASGLAVSAWWLLFAAALVALGFRLALQPARVAGLAVAGLAVFKVIFFDLSTLDALYRVGSVFLLALVALSLAYLYYRHDRSQRA
ncbi:MAG TPA: DUF2339 domain-containing protein [Gemmatimonadales bacterium]|nr:DUF2339 domain-containing protein [Gemmatimonadales bacterium]